MISQSSLTGTTSVERFANRIRVTGCELQGQIDGRPGSWYKKKYGKRGGYKECGNGVQRLLISSPEEQGAGFGTVCGEEELTDVFGAEGSDAARAEVEASDGVFRSLLAARYCVSTRARCYFGEPFWQRGTMAGTAGRAHVQDASTNQLVADNPHPAMPVLGIA
eukprot:2649985-Rhodomonas_salina.1